MDRYRLFWNALILAPVLTPPWNVACWAGGWAYYKVTTGKAPAFDELFWLPTQILGSVFLGGR